MGKGRSVRTGVLCSIGLVVMLAVGEGSAVGAEGSASLDEPVDTITDTVDEPVDTITDTVDDPADTITDTVDDPADTITDTVDDPVDDVADTVDDTSDTVDETTGPVDDTTETVTDAVDETVGATGGSTDDALGSIAGESEGSETSGGALDAAANTAAGAEVASSSVRSTALPGPAGSPGTSAFVGSDDPSDLDDLAAGGNDVVGGSAAPVCVGTADIICLELIGGGELSVLFRAAEETRKAVSAFVDGLVRTGADLLGEIALFVALMITGFVLTSRRRRPNTAPTGTERPVART